jgi:hypothetical protein
MSNARHDGEQERLNLALSSAEMGTWDWDVPSGVIWWDERIHALLDWFLRASRGVTRTFWV